MWRWFRKTLPESASARRRRAAGVPEDPDAFMRWSIDRHARSERMVVSQDDITRLPAEMARLSATLRHLSLRHCGLTDISALAGMLALETLDITACPVTDLRCLADLPALRSLTLSLPKGIRPTLPEIPALERLDLVCGYPVDLPALPGLRSLRAQNLTSLEPVRAMPRLQELSVTGLSVPDLGPLAGKETLTALEMRARRVRDLTPLAGLAGLHSLKLMTAAASDLDPIGGLTGLKTLFLHAPRATSLQPLAGLKRLEDLRIEAPPPEGDPGWMPRAAPLRALYLSEPRDLALLQGFDSLETLILAFARPLDLAPLSALPSLQSLSLLARGDWPRALRLPPLPGVRKLMLRGAAFATLDGLEQAAGLQELSLNRVGVTTLDPLAALPRLAAIEVSDSPLEDVSALAFLPCFAEQGQARLILRDTKLPARHPELERYCTMHPRDAHERGAHTAWAVATYARALVRSHRA